MVDRRDLTTIRPLPRAPQTIDRNTDFRHTLLTMQRSGFHAWNFVIVRTTAYTPASNDAFRSFMDRLHTEAAKGVTWMPTLSTVYKDPAIAPCLLPLIRWTVLEDPSLAGLDVEQATRRFDDWRAGVSVERDGEGADHVAVRIGAVARFRYFVIVDDEALESSSVGGMKVRVVDAGRPLGCEIFYGMSPEETATRDRERQEREEKERAEWEVRRQMAAGDEDEENENEEEDEGEDLQNEHELVEGCARWDVGWMWVEAEYLSRFYEIVMADSGWDNYYVRPPKIYPRDSF